MKRNVARRIFVILLLAVSVLLNAAAWLSKDFSDFYTNKIFPVITRGYSALTSMAPFSVGERMLVLLILIALVYVIYLVFRIITATGKLAGKDKVKSFGRHFYRVMSVVFSIVFLIMTLNCFILYHCMPLKVAEEHRDDYTIAELAALRDYIVTKCNEMAEQMPRDEKGYVVYDGDMKETAKESMKNLEGIYERLGGFFATPKELTFSGFMSQQYMQGYYFPFSMEANINSQMYIMNKPFTICHELSHTHGYIYEDEANFLGFLGCIRSSDEIFNYSGYLGVLAYVNNDFYKSVSKEEYKSHVAISERVKFDSQFLTDEAWEEVEKRAILETETVKKAADTFIDTNLKVNGVSEGKASYSKVVGLLLDYYSVNPYN